MKKVYGLIKTNLSLNKDYSLSDQLKRACVSIPANIAEGFCRTKKQFINYLLISVGSVNEMITLLKIVTLVYYIKTDDLQEEYRYLGKQITLFSKNVKNSL